MVYYGGHYQYNFHYGVEIKALEIVVLHVKILKEIMMHKIIWVNYIGLYICILSKMNWYLSNWHVWHKCLYCNFVLLALFY